MKAHLLDSDEPLARGKDWPVLCGAEVSKAEFVFFFDVRSMGLPLAISAPLLFCKKCAEGYTSLPNCSKGRYLYGLIDGEKAKHLEEL